ncbi:ABC transporter permease [Anaeromyxobacter oryzisoli]|uniref:ABC transporter permease n=1 Tax=Anaeromyxobacter oryzisoli TaxID=2925408 RepID=UPI001F593F91|nr:ABC transporter permease subunit [Anaeromyxobacter sp. SG63]
MGTIWIRAWGDATAFLRRSSRRLGLADLVVLAAIAGIAYALTRAAASFTGVLRPRVEIDLSPRALPGYALLSLSRGLAAYVLSLFFTLGYGYWAAKDRRAERILVPLLDVLQSVPVLGFMPGLVLALVALFPRSNAGLELAAVVMIFTGQAWNMTFSFYRSVRSVPPEQLEVARTYRFSWGEQLRWVELPASVIGLVWNSMMSMAGGWFFLMVSEAFVLGDKDFRLPGLGSYMSVAVARGDGPAMAWAVLAMTIMIVALDQLLWRPVVVWSQKFRQEDAGQAEAAESWFLEVLRRSHLLATGGALLDRIGAALRRRARATAADRDAPARGAPLAAQIVTSALFFVLVGCLAVGAFQLVLLMRSVPGREWGLTVAAALATLGRVLLATALGTLWALPAGLAIGLSPRLSRILQPVVQVVASFPAPMLFPAAIALLAKLGVGLGAGSVVLMLLGTQWYILFNVVAGAMAVPADLREAATSYGIRGFALFRQLLLPSVLPYLVTGWVTAAGGAWNASIVSEYVTAHHQTLSTFGLGARVSAAAEHADFPALAASVVVMSVMVVFFNRLVWRPLSDLAERRYALAR